MSNADAVSLFAKKLTTKQVDTIINKMKHLTDCGFSFTSSLIYQLVEEVTKKELEKN